MGVSGSRKILQSIQRQVCDRRFSSEDHHRVVSTRQLFTLLYLLQSESVHLAALLCIFSMCDIRFLHAVLLWNSLSQGDSMENNSILLCQSKVAHFVAFSGKGKVGNFIIIYGTNYVVKPLDDLIVCYKAKYDIY